MSFKFGLICALCFIVGALAQTNNSTADPSTAAPSTAAPSTAAPTTAAPSTVAPSPTPAVPEKADSGKWALNDTGKICILFEASVRFEFHYANATVNNVTNSVDLLNKNYNVSSTTTAGSCGTDKQNIEIGFFEDEWKLDIEFTHIATNESWYLSGMKLKYNLAKGQLPLPDVNATYAATAEKVVEEYHAKENKSYECESKQEYVNFTLPEEATPVLKSISFRNMHVEAFRVSKSQSFSSSITCPDDAVSNIVPIAVGAALGALVLIVLIAYLIGRRKSRRGYESV